MGSRENSAPSRVRWIVVFALILLAAVATPVLAESPSEGPGEAPAGEAAAEVPAPDVTAQIAEIESEQREQAKWLAGPEATQQREASQGAYTALTSVEAQALLSEAFPEQLQNLNADPARALSDLEIEKPLGTYGARIAVGEGESAIVESSTPVQSEVGGEGQKPVDLTLEPSAEGFVPQNPITEVELPASAQAPIQLQSGVEVELPSSDDHAAVAFGDKNLFYPETDATTDTLLAPVSGGVEVFEQLRSPESPQQFRFQLGLPQGATLHPRGEGGAEVLSAAGKAIEEVPTPIAFDAQGAEVPVTMSVEGEALVLDVPHRSSDVAYPVLVDPRFNNGFESPPFGEWVPGETAEYNLANNGGSSLSAVSKGSNFTYGANTWGQWVYTAPGETTYIEDATFSPIYFLVNNCQTAQPHGYVGIYNVYSGAYNSLGVYSGGNVSGATFATGFAGGFGTRLAVLGIGTAGASSKLACAHELYVGGVTVQENDPENPTINSVSGVPGGWFDPGKAGNVTIGASDPGFGVDQIRIANSGGNTIYDIPPNPGCTGMSGSRCPRNRSWPIAPPYKEGERQLLVSAEDPSGKVGEWATTTKVDATKPEIELGGQLAVITKEEGLAEKDQSLGEDQLRLPVYNLHIKATDGSKESALTKRSGLKNIEVFLDGVKQTVPWTALPSCPESSCAMEKDFPLKLAGVSAGVHKLRVLATDQVNLEREREIEFEYFPATGMKDEYVMQHFPLGDGTGAESEEELAVNVMSGNLVYHQRDLQIPGPSVDVGVERFYNSQMPKAESTEWGAGWTLAETPELELEKAKGSPPTKTPMMRASGLMEGSVGLPTEVNQERFDAKLQAMVTKEPGGGYEVADETGETEADMVYDSSGKPTELEAPGDATVDYEYEGGHLAEIAVDDPASTTQLPSEVEVHPFPPSYESTFGTQGAAAGQLYQPFAIARDSKGNIWIADSGNYRIAKFSESGTFILAVGKGVNKTKEVSGTEAEKNLCTAASGAVCQAGKSGAADGQFAAPAGIAIDPGGNVWVTDPNNNRIQEFNEKGEYVRKTGATGTGNGQFKMPMGIAADTKGNVWVADSGNNRIQKFNEKAEFLATYGSFGTGNGQFNLPMGVAIDFNGNVWIADTYNSRVQKLSESGAFISKFGTKGSGNGQLQAPQTLAVDVMGNVWVVDVGNSRIQEFDSKGQFMTKAGGVKGSGAGQLDAPAGLVLNTSSSRLWVVDYTNNRVQQWHPRPRLSKSTTTYESALGSLGVAGGQLKQPLGMARDSKGNLWVADSTNNRIERFSEDGTFIATFGYKVNKTKVDESAATGLGVCTASSGDVCQAGTTGGEVGQLNAPSAVSVDPKGNVWVADKGNNRIQEFAVAGTPIKKVGISGIGNGQFRAPAGVVVDPAGNVWVADTNNNRIQKFNEKAEFLGAYGTVGTGNRQFSAPTGVAIDSAGNLWVADTNNNRIQELNQNGDFIQAFGVKGSGEGQLDRPGALAFDAAGYLWVADLNNSRIQKFSVTGKYLGQLGGAKGSGTEQLSLTTLPAGLAFDSTGAHVWVADGDNNRIQKWAVSNIAEPGEETFSENDDVNVDVVAAAGLVTSVEPDTGADVDYAHTGQTLTAATGPNGETKYKYDGSERLIEVQLPGGTWGKVEYEALGRVKAVTVSIKGGKAKTTNFEYKDEPRSTTVTPEGEQAITYDIGADGSVLKWKNVIKAPEIEQLLGSLYVQRGEVHPEPITNGDQNLLVQAHSVEGIASIQIIANGDQLVAEKTCAQDLGKPGTECINESKELVTNTASWPPGYLQLEVIVTDRLGNLSSQRFWVNIPQAPPAGSEAPDPPQFAEVLRFREEFGLDLDLKGDEGRINERIFQLINDWNNPNTPMGEVARASSGRWGVPLRPVDVAEMEYREWYLAVNGPSIEDWAYTNYPSTYAGYQMDNAAGGIIRIGFTQNQGSRVAEFLQQVNPPAADRITTYQSVPTQARSSLETLETEVANAAGTDPQLSTLATEVGISDSTNTITVGTANVTATQQRLTQLFGSLNGIIVINQPEPPESQTARDRQTGRMIAGDRVWTDWTPAPSSPLFTWGTAGFGAYENTFITPQNKSVRTKFLLDAGHMGAAGALMYRIADSQASAEDKRKNGRIIGRIERNPHFEGSQRIDALAMPFNADGLAPVSIFGNDGRRPAIGHEGVARLGQTLCVSGARTERVKCGAVIGVKRIKFSGDLKAHGVLVVDGLATRKGDSGAPVWNPRTGAAIGILSGGYEHGTISDVQPLLDTPVGRKTIIPGALNDPLMGNLHIITGG